MAGACPKQPAIQAAVSGKAERRRHLLNRLAQTNPAAVLDLAMSPAERAALPANLRSAVEERVTVDGELVVLHHDFEDGHSEYEMKLVKGGQETPVKFGAPIGQAKPGDHVKSDGVALAGDQTVVTDSMIVVQSPPRSARPARSAPRSSWPARPRPARTRTPTRRTPPASSSRPRA